MIIAVDFDGTCVTHEFPYIGEDIKSVDVLKELVNKGHKIILYTMRSHKKCKDVEDPLQEAIDWFRSNNIPLWGINENPEQKSWTDSNKIYANLYIDDANLGVPLCYSSLTRLYIDWNEVYKKLKNMAII